MRQVYRLVPLSFLVGGHNNGRIYQTLFFILFTGLWFLPSVVSAQTLTGTSIVPTNQWKACLNGAPPSTQNIPATTLDGALPFGIDIMDSNPDWDDVILDFDDALSSQEILAYTRQLGLDARLNSAYSQDTNVYVARVEEGAVPYIRDCLDKNAPAGWLEAVEENFEYRVFGEVPDDPLYQFQWNFKQVGAESAWRSSTGRDVVVAVIDTGVSYEDAPNLKVKAGKDILGTKIVPGYDFVDNSDFVFDGHGHGTHVAGTIAQTTNNAYGVAGLAYNAKIMPLRVLNSRGMGQVADIADSVRFAADNGAHVINMSLGGPLPSLVLKRAIDYAHKKGVTIVAAAGNSGRRAPSYPAAYKHVIAVAATQYDRSTTFYSQWGSYVDIAAPGGNTRVDQVGDGRPDGIMQETLKPGTTDQHDFLLYMGTSMASPHVAAAAAMIISQGVTHPDKVLEILQATADSSMKDKYGSDDEFHERYGAGLLQVDKAVQAAAMTQGGWRLAGAMTLALFALISVRRRDLLGISPASPGLLIGTSVIVAAGVFIGPMLLGSVGIQHWLVDIFARPLAQYDVFYNGLASHQNPLLASVLVPIGAYALLGGHKTARIIACGIALGMAAFCLTEAWLLTSDVRWIPGMNILDRAWLIGNGLLSFLIGYVGLKRY